MDRKKRRKRRVNFIKPFLCTFCIFVSAGVLVMASYKWIMEPAEDILPHQQTPAEEIPKSSKEPSEDSTSAKPDGESLAELGKEPAAPPSKYQEELDDLTYMAQNRIYTKEAKTPDSVTLAFAGDILFDPSYAVMATMLQNGGVISNAISPELIEEMQAADIMMLNNEFPYSDRGVSTEGKQFTFRAKPAYVAYLDALGVDLVSLANNHAYDYGEEAFLDTMTTLEEDGIVYLGAGKNLEEARHPVYYIINDIKIAFVAATQIERLDYPDTKGATDTSAGVFRCWDGTNLTETVKEAKENSDFVIAFLHWGTENVDTIDWAQEKQAREVAEAGADLIIGAHPHCLQPVSVVQGVPVFYSIGNFWFNSKTIDTGIVKVTLTGDGMESCQFVPCLQSGCKTKLLGGEEKERVLDYLQGISQGVAIDADGYVTWRQEAR